VRYFEAQTFQGSFLEVFLHESKLQAEDLVLVSSPDGKTTDTPLFFSYDSIKNIKSLSCYGVRPRVDKKLFTGKQAQLGLLRLVAYQLDDKDMITFIEASGAETLSFELSDDWIVIEGNEVEEDIELTRLTTMTTPLELLPIVFNQHVFLPNLLTLTVEQDSG
jgi:hypothetical protein